ncbi:Zn-ribbon domain-containing OB-fold protein [Pseudomonas typographi]|uniref:Nucleic acid-binding protein n=1 Tax=Pseudomonas typographi TaxID=2715964 RepID=A0ABR7Z237_9PSED|nr:OB-fold domain-containing protein [Pseudomonas typographi]MBD1551458.1 nucleic acid-binding protein [Pseudomonas typographi]MBD1587556.1 nucleic acid-binding protein [Pseudomonas typographi]MBD1599361.1 nucleic acid-binding protein [Pseudomonas typographi]
MTAMHPQGVGPQATYEAFLREGRFMLQRSRATGRHVFYPRVLVPGSGEADLEWVPASGLGTLYAITVDHAREGDRNIILVQLDEGPRMMACLVDCLAAPIGTRLKAEVQVLGEHPAVVFRCLGEVQP